MKDTRGAQRSKILELLISAHGDWVPLPKIRECASQYNARIFELRRFGFEITNRMQDVNGSRHSWFRLLEGPELSIRDPQSDRVAKAREWLSVARGETAPTSATGLLFGDLSPDRSYTE